MILNKSAGNVAIKGRGSSSSCSSRPLLPFLINHSDSAIGSSLDGSFSCSFLPPPPPYRPNPLIESGSDGILSTEQQRKTPQGKDFTSLLGFDTLVLPSAMNTRSGSEEEQKIKHSHTPAKILKMDAPIAAPQQTLTSRNTDFLINNHSLVGNNRSKNNFSPMTAKKQHLVSSNTQSSLSHTFEGNNMQFEQSPSPSVMLCSEFSSDQERIQHLIVSRDNLSMKVEKLTRQVALQREKIREMETMLNARRNGEVKSNRNSNEVESIEPIAQELANLQHKNLALEREKFEAERRLRLSNSELEHCISEQPSLSKTQRFKNGDGSSINRAEFDRLQLAIQRLLADNEQKDSQIQCLRSALDEQRRRTTLTRSECPTPPLPFHNLQQSQLDINEQIRHILFNDENGQHQQNNQQMAHSNSFPLSLCSTVACSSGQQVVPRIHHQLQQQKKSHQQYQQPFPAFLPMSNSFTFALGTQQQKVAAYTPLLWRVSSPPTIPPHLMNSPRPPASPMARQLAAELDELRRSGGICSAVHPPYSSASLPRSIHSKSNSLGSAPKLIYQQPPNIYGGSDDETASRFSASTNNFQQNGNKSAHNKKEKRGRRPRSTLRSFLGRFAHRGNSLQDLRPSPRFPSPISFLTTNSPATTFDSTTFCLNPPIRQFVEWDGQKCNRWLHESGFDGYSIDAVHSGRHLVNMSDKDFERDLGIKSALQRKRLKCLLTRIERSVEYGELEASDSFDTNQVIVWLDLIGLPQYRDLFANYRMDGCLLLELSAQDLLELGIHSALNHASLARAIQFLRSAEFHLHRIEGHFNTDSLSRTPMPTEVERWSHKTTLGWLCSIDLAEFTQNLAFSGVHGALMVLEPTFTSESLAELLQIPLQKTLLRRHLTTQFNTLLGQKVINHKRDVLTQPFVTHLTPSLRIKLSKKSVGVGFSLSRKKSKSDIFVEPEVRVCPAETNVTSSEAITNV